MTETVSKISQGDRVYEHVRAEVLSCRMAPGERLNIAQLSGVLSASQGGIREALSRLTMEGLLVADLNKGFRVTPLSPEECIELTKARSELDGLCLRMAMKKDSVDWEADLIAACHRVSRRFEQAKRSDQDIPALAAAYDHFQQILVAGCNNRQLQWVRGLLYTKGVRYRSYCLTIEFGEHPIFDENSEFIRSIRAHDADRAIALLTDEYETAAGRICEHLKANAGDISSGPLSAKYQKLTMSA